MKRGLAKVSYGKGSRDFPSPSPFDTRNGYLHVPRNSRLLLGETRALTGQAVFLDRDGVLVEDVTYLSSADQLRLLPGVGEALRSLQDRFSLVVITNQSGIARGFLTEDDLQTIHLELIVLLAAEEVVVDALYYCPHLPDAPESFYSQECGCRKPRPGMLLRARADFGIDLSRSFLIGDRPSDIQAGEAAGVKSILLSSSRDANSGSTVAAREISAAADLILANDEHLDPASSGQMQYSENSVVQRGSACQ